jgi:hypothetical protein
MSLDTAALVARVMPALLELARSRGRDPFSLMVELLVAMNPEAFRKWADDGFP